jgi:hypothetical protein
MWVTFLLPRFSELFAGRLAIWLTQAIVQSLCSVFTHATTETPRVIKDAAALQGLSPDHAVFRRPLVLAGYAIISTQLYLVLAVGRRDDL